MKNEAPKTVDEACALRAVSQADCWQALPPVPFPGDAICVFSDHEGRAWTVEVAGDEWVKVQA